jgi:hypothetical protein
MSWFWDHALDIVEATDAHGVMVIGRRAVEVCLYGFYLKAPAV